MVKLEDNSYTWYLPIKLYQSASGEWIRSPEVIVISVKIKLATLIHLMDQSS
ncbi:MAG: hypothetical protein OXE42_19030 [Gammaproteobacteria bacterium]|nr:hypothetical protein [Gammaproteobacteria bacterium]